MYTYAVASRDMYYAEEEQREVLLGRDDAGHIRLWGAPNGGPDSRIGLCRVFLEYGMYCESWCGKAEALYHMQDFGERLGHAVAAYLQENPDLLAADDPTFRALEHVFWATGAAYSEEHIESGVSFLLSHCPVEEAAKRSGLSSIELARHGINALCRTLIHDMNPLAVVLTSPDSSPEFRISITDPARSHH
jgi:hypothetical protein